MNGSPVTDLVAPEIGAAAAAMAAVDGDSAARSLAVSKLTFAAPEATVACRSATKALPFHFATTLDGVIARDRMLRMSGLRKVP
jgi:hypothetical protein